MPCPRNIRYFRDIYKQTSLHKMDLIERKIKNIVRRVLNEEQGINQEVYEAANKVLSLIRKNVKSALDNEEYNSTFDGNAYVVQGEFPFTINGEEIMVIYNSYMFQDQETYSSYIRKYPKMLMNATSRYDKDDCEIFVVYNCTQENGYDESIYDRVQHELEHLFQEIQKNGQFPSSDLKGRVNKGLGMRLKNPNVFKASFILYCSRKYEQDAFANGLYSWLQNGTTDKNEIVKGSGLVKYRRICLKYINELEALMDDEKERNKISDFLGISLGNVIKKGRKACEEMKDKANRTIYKYMQDTGEKIKFIK